MPVSKFSPGLMPKPSKWQCNGTRQAEAASAEGIAMATFVFELDIQTILTTLQRVEGKIDELLGKVNVMSQATDNLAAAVQKETSVQASAIALILGLADQIKQLSTEPQVQALADQLNANADALARAVTANTPTPADGSAQTIPPTSVA
jgi:hypothetical protein